MKNNKNEKVSAESLEALEKMSVPQEAIPRVEWSSATGKGSITTPPQRTTDGEPDWDFILDNMGLNPDLFEIVSETVRISRWQSFDGNWLSSYRGQIRRKITHAVDIEELSKYIWASPSGTSSNGTISEDHRVIMLTDTHLGKSKSDGAGTPLLIKRWKAGVYEALKDGVEVPFQTVTLAFGGDLIEGYVSQNGRNIAGTDLTLPDQILTATQLVTWTIQEALDVADRVVVVAVPGNHGETTRVQGRTMSDSHDIQIVRQAQLIMDAAGFENSNRLEFIYPEEIWASTLR